MNLNKIRLELARDHDFPDGSRERGYEFTAPLGEDGGITRHLARHLLGFTSIAGS